MFRHLKVSVVIPAHNRRKITLECLAKLTNIVVEGASLDVIVVDDGSTDGTSAAIREKYPYVTLLRGNGSLWWSGATNLGVQYALKNNVNYVLALNDDVEFEFDFIARMLETASEFSKAIVCGLICYEYKRDIILSAGRYRSGFLGYKTPARHVNEDAKALNEQILESELESGYAMLIPAELFKLIGFFDEKRFPHHMGDMDFVLRARKAGYHVLVNTRARLYTNPGKNYLFNMMVEKDVVAIVRSCFQIRSNAYWRTRLNFMTMHTKPRILAPIAFVHYVVRMSVLLVLKALMPKSVMQVIVNYRYGSNTYSNQQ
jgi:GT2 family glycosyltransferase